jgi:hypothetical protein
VGIAAGYAAWAEQGQEHIDAERQETQRERKGSKVSKNKRVFHALL